MKNDAKGLNMFEPINIPQLNHSLTDLADLRFKIGIAQEIRRPEEWEDPLHIHNHYEILFNLSSNATMLLEERSYPLSHGSAVVVKPQQIHICQFHKVQLHEFFCLWIDVKKDSPLLSFFDKENLYPLYTFDNKTASALTDLFFTLYEYSKQNENLTLEKAVCLLQILQIFKQHSSTAPVQNEEMPTLLIEIINHIQKNFAEIDHIKNIANKYFISTSTLNRWFRQYLHTTPHEYLEMYKLKNAQNLLVSGYSVTDACMDSGFPDCSHFISLFRKKFGKTPLQYRRSLHK